MSGVMSMICEHLSQPAALRGGTTDGVPMTKIPATIDEVTVEWLAAATGLAVTGLDAEIIGVGIGVSSAVYRLHLSGTDVPEDPGAETAGA